ncbi:MAG: hypothetical protein WCT02_02645 [Candidatus Paceibacterota bacterium]|jgi:hypothetical protein
MAKYLGALFVLILVLVGQIFGIGGLYFQLSFLDIILHILGGLGIGLLASALYDSGLGRSFGRRRFIFLVVLAAGLVWEGLEVNYDIARYSLWTTPYYLDTLKDLLDDIIGGALVVISLGRVPNSKDES